jgi:hypothetical protein
MTPPRNRASDFANVHPVWFAINALLVKAIPPLFVACTLTITGGALFTYVSVHKLIERSDKQEKRQDKVEAEIEQIQMELMELSLIVGNAQNIRDTRRRLHPQ